MRALKKTTLIKNTICVIMKRRKREYSIQQKRLNYTGGVIR